MSNEADPKTGRPRRYELWILILSGFVLFHRPLFFKESFYFRDLHLHFFPQKLRFIEFIRSAQLPLWDPYLNGGQPYLADLNNMALYPTNLLYVVLPPLFALNLDIVFHILLCAVAVYCLARSLGLSPVASLVAGAMYGFCGYTLSLANLLNRLAAMPYLPLILLAFQRYLSLKKSKWFVCAVILGVFQVFAGAPEMVLLTWMTVFVFTCVNGRPVNAIACMCLFLLIAGIAAVQILPAIEMVRQSTRSAGTGYATFSAWSLNPKRISEMILPGFLGSTAAATTRGYWGFRLESTGFPFILSVYFGIVPLFCASFGIGGTRRNKALALLACVGFLLSIGSYLPGFRNLYEHFRILAVARYPIKFLALALLPVSLIVASGFERIFEPEPKRQRRAATALWIAALTLTCAYLMITFSLTIGQGFLHKFFNSSSETAYQGVKLSIGHATCISLLAALVYQHWLMKRNNWNRTAFGVLILFDLLWAGYPVNEYAPSDFFHAQPQLAQAVVKEIGEGRLYRAKNPPDLVFQLPDNTFLHLYRWNLETLQDYSGALYSIPVIYHSDFDDLAKREIAQLSNSISKLPWERRIPFLTTAGVSLVLSSDVIALPDLKILARVTNSSNKPFFLYRNVAFQGLALVPQQIEVLRSPQEVFQRMTVAEYDPRKTMITTDARFQAQPQCSETQLNPLEQKSNTWKYTARSACDTYVYFSQPFYKGWVTTVDGNEVPSVQANYAFTASLLPKGQHTLERTYSPASFRLGVIISFVSALLLFLTARTSQIL